PEEWSRLDQPDYAALQQMDPDHGQIVVVEVNGEIVAVWAAVAAIHVEHLVVRPEVRHNPRVTRALMDTMAHVLRTFGATEVLSRAESADIETLMTKVGGRPLPGRLWVFPVVDLHRAGTGGGD